MIGVAAQLCGVHPQTLRQYERLGLVTPSRVGAKNRLYSEGDIARVRRIQRLTQQLGVNLAGVEIILKLLDDIDDTRRQFQRQFDEYVEQTERVVQDLLKNPSAPIRKDASVFLVPRVELEKKIDL